MIHLKKYKYNWQTETYDLEKATELTTDQATAVKKYFDGLISPAYLFYKWELIDKSSTHTQTVFVAVGDLLGYLHGKEESAKELKKQQFTGSPSEPVAAPIDKTQVEQNVVTIIKMLKSMCRTFGIDIKPLLKKEL